MITSKELAKKEVSENELGEITGKKRQWLALKRLKGQLTPSRVVRNNVRPSYFYVLDEAMIELGVHKSPK